MKRLSAERLEIHVEFRCRATPGDVMEMSESADLQDFSSNASHHVPCGQESGQQSACNKMRP